MSRGSGSAWCAGEAVGLLPAGTQHLAQVLTADPMGWAQKAVSDQLLQVFQKMKCHSKKPRCQFSFGVVA